MSKLNILGIVFGLSILSLGSCNSTYEPGESIASSAAVYSFSVKGTTNQLADVDTVFFTVDLIKSQIFNADSLPYGTRVNALIPSVKTLDGVSAMEYIVKRPGLSDTVYDFIKNPNDSIDFSNGPVSLHIVSPDGLVERTYTVTVNVHKIKSDSLEWALTKRVQLPTSLPGTVARTGAALAGEKAYILTADNTGLYSLMSSEDAYSGVWVEVESDLGTLGNPVPESLRGGDENLYILNGAGRMFSSSDGGENWTDSGFDYAEIFGELSGVPVGTTRMSDGTYGILNGTTGAVEALPGDDFPVTGASAGVLFSFPMSTNPNLVILGGRTASGTLCDAAWCFDGTNWARLSNTPLPDGGLENMALVPYTSFADANVWDTEEYACLLAFGGRNASGEARRTVYISRDYGMSWRVADELLQLPEYFPASYGMQGFVMNHLTKAEDLARIPGMMSRATKPVTSWEVRYIFLAGGYTADGNNSPYLWCGVINRLSFKPLI